MEDISALQSGKLGKGLKKFLTEEVVDKGKTKESLVVIGPYLGSCSCILHGTFLNFFIPLQGVQSPKKLSTNVNALAEGSNGDLWRGIRTQLTAFLEGLDPKGLATMSLGLRHSLAWYVEYI